MKLISKMNKTNKFSLKSFFSKILEEVKINKLNDAEAIFLQGLTDLQNSNINRKEKLNSLYFLSRILQQKGISKHGYEKLFRKTNPFKNQHFFNPQIIPSNGVFVDLGCGAHDPIALATYFYLNGFKKSYAIDMKPPSNEYFSALSMYSILSNLFSFPERFIFQNKTENEIINLAKKFDLNKFEDGDFYGGFAPLVENLKYEICDIVDSSIKNESVSFLVSFAVLEHVDSLEEVLNKIYDLMMPGGIVYHFIDLMDHRAYRLDSEFHPLSFLADENPPKNLNRFRASEQLEAQKNAGFEIISSKASNKVDMPDEIYQKLSPKFKKMDLDDICITKLHIVARKKPN